MNSTTDQIPEFPTCPHCDAKLFSAGARICAVCEKPTQYVNTPYGRLIPTQLFDKVPLPGICSQCNAATTNFHLLKFQGKEGDPESGTSISALIIIGWLWVYLLKKFVLTSKIEIEIQLPLCGNCVTSNDLRISEVDFPQKRVRVFVHDRFSDRMVPD